MQNGAVIDVEDIEQKRRRRWFGARKSPVIPEMVKEHNRYILSVAVLSAENVDEATGVFNCVRGYYQVRITASHFPATEYCRTGIVRGDEVFPKWLRTVQTVFEERPVGEYLLLEVVQYGRRGDPGTSTGTAVVGRAQIPVPEKVGLQGKRKYNLVSIAPLGKTIGGFIWLDMMLEAEPL